jgi:hypothetical protein
MPEVLSLARYDSLLKASITLGEENQTQVT